MAEVGKNKTLFRWVHSKADDIAAPDRKAGFANDLEKAGFRVEMKTYTERDVDGRYIKTAEHGMNLSMRQFFDRCYTDVKDMLKTDQTIDYDYPHSFEFKCDTQSYVMNYSGDAQPRCSLSDLN